MTNEENRAILVNRLRENLPEIRKIAGMSGEEFGQFLGMSRQSVSKLETKTSVLSVAQYVAIRHILDAWMIRHPENKTLPRIIHLLLDERRLWGHPYTQLQDIAKSIAASTMSGVGRDTIDASAKMLLDAWEPEAMKYCIEGLQKDFVSEKVGVGPDDVPMNWTDVIMGGKPE